MQTMSTGQQALDIRYYFSVIRNRALSVLLVTAIALGFALGLSFLQTPVYVATAKVVVKLPVSPTGAPVAAGELIEMETEAEIAKSQEVAAVAAPKVPDATPSEVLGAIDVEAPVETQVLVITYSDPSPRRAATGAQAVASAYLEYKVEQAQEALELARLPLDKRLRILQARLSELNKDLEGRQGPVNSGISVRRDVITSELGVIRNQLALLGGVLVDPGEIIDVAEPPTSPARPNHALNGILGLAVGLILGVVIALLRERLDDKIRTPDELAAASRAPVLGLIPTIARRVRNGSVFLAGGKKTRPAQEAYRALRASLSFAIRQRELKVVMVTSAEPGAGKSTTAANLAVAMAQANSNVILVSGDLHQPTLTRIFGVDSELGLGDYLANPKITRGLYTEVGVPGLRLVASSATTGTTERLSSPAMKDLMGRLRESADIVLIDTPPVLSVSDALLLAPYADGALFVARAGSTIDAAVEEARIRLSQVGTDVIGSVLNHAQSTEVTLSRRSYGGAGNDENGKSALSISSSRTVGTPT